MQALSAGDISKPTKGTGFSLLIIIIIIIINRFV